MEIIFNSPEYLWLLFSLPILILVHFMTLNKIKRRAVKFANFSAIQRITGGEVLSKNLFLLLIRGIVLLLFILSIAGATFIYTGKASNFDYVLAMDNSNSMIVEDFMPTRFDAAKMTAKSFVDKIGPDNYVGIISFSSVSKMETPLSNDYFHVKSVIDRIKLSEVGGTDMGNALINSANLLLNSEKGKAIILITDGQTNIGLSLVDAVDYVNMQGITVYTIGIGTPEGSDFFGTTLVLDEQSLSYIAATTNGKYFRAENTEQLKDAYDQVLNIGERKVIQNLSMTFIVIALLLLLYEWFLINTKYRTIP